MSKLTPEIELEIRREVEDRLLKLPAETLRLVQEEVDRRVAKAEASYNRLFFVTVTAATLLLAGFFGLTWNSVSSRLTSLIADTEIKRKIEVIEKAFVNVTKHEEDVKQSARRTETAVGSLTTRLAELAQMDRIVTYDAAGNLDLKSNGRLRLGYKHGGNTNDYFELTFEAGTGRVYYETFVRGKMNITILQDGVHGE